MDYRIRYEESAGLTSKEIVERVVYQIANDAPEYSNDLEMAAFLGTLPTPLASIFSAWMTLGFAAVGGTLHVFESCCPSMVYAAIHGFDLLGESHGADCLKAVACAFPDHEMPDDFDQLVLGLIVAGADVEALAQFDDRKPLDDYFIRTDSFEAFKSYFVSEYRC